MSLTSRRGSFSDLVEDWSTVPAIESRSVYRGPIFEVVKERIDLGRGGIVERDRIQHPGAVVILAMRPMDGIDHVLLIRQYRHPAGGHLWELPAGLLDEPGEPAVDAARRELLEEVDLSADTWNVLADDLASPGVLPEAVRIFLARDLHEVPDADQHQRTAEELTLRPIWVPLDDAVQAVLAGQISNAAAQLGLLAADASRARNWSSLRPADAPWPARQAQLARAEATRPSHQ